MLRNYIEVGSCGPSFATSDLTYRGSGIELLLRTLSAQSRHPSSIQCSSYQLKLSRRPGSKKPNVFLHPSD